MPRVFVASLLFTMLLLARPAVAHAHTGEEAAFKHVIIEFGLWGMGLVVVLALLVAVLWVRARMLR